MSTRSFKVFIIILGLIGCDDSFNGVSKSLVDQVEKLNSPNEHYSFYRYHVEAAMAFGSGSTRMTILEASRKLDHETSDFFVLNDGAPVALGWKDSKTIKLIALTNGGSEGDSAPYKREIKNWKDFYIEIDYYKMYSTGASNFEYDSLRISGDSIFFLNPEESKFFVKGKAEMSYNPTMFTAREIQVDLDSLGNGKSLVSSNCWEFKASSDSLFKRFISSGVLIQEHP